MIDFRRSTLIAALSLLSLAGSHVASAQTSLITFESGPVRPLALSPDGSQLFAVNIPDGILEIFDVDGGGPLTQAASVAAAARSNSEVWVVSAGGRARAAPS